MEVVLAELVGGGGGGVEGAVWLTDFRLNLRSARASVFVARVVVSLLLAFWVLLEEFGVGGFLLLLVVTIDFAASCSLRAGGERERWGERGRKGDTACQAEAKADCDLRERYNCRCLLPRDSRAKLATNHAVLQDVLAVQLRKMMACSID